MKDRLTTYCDCSDTSHTMQFMLLPTEDNIPNWGPPELYVSVQLNQRHPWWKRVYYGLLYVFGKRSKFSYGHWDEGNISSGSARELMSLLRKFLLEQEKWNKESRMSK